MQMITESMWLSIASMVVTLLLGVIGYLNIKPQGRNFDSSTAAQYQEIADKAGKKVEEMQARQDKFETEIANLKAEIREANKRADQANERAERFENWAKRLAFQVRSLNAVPVELDPTRPLGAQ